MLCEDHFCKGRSRLGWRVKVFSVSQLGVSDGGIQLPSRVCARMPEQEEEESGKSAQSL